MKSKPVTRPRRRSAVLLVPSVFLYILVIALTGLDARAGQPSSEVEVLRREVEELRRREDENRAKMAELERLLHQVLEAQSRGASPSVKAPAPAAHDGTPSASWTTAAPKAVAPTPQQALDRALANPAPAIAASPSAAASREEELEPAGPSAPTVAATSGARSGDVWSAPIAGGAAQARLLDIALATLVAGGGSSVGNDALETLEGGGHDPNKNGFTLQQVELSLSGAVDPYFTGEAHIVATDHGVELEEAFFTTTALPLGLQVEAGYSLTEFGLLNPSHPHSWDWLDQPVVNTRMFGGEGTRSPGARIAWLLPVPFFSELHLGVQNANEGEFTPSFIGEEGVGGRPNVGRDVRGLDDLLWLARSNSSWDLGSETALLLGASALYGPNETGPDGSTWIYGIDAKLRWRPHTNFRGWPFVVWQTEVMGRSYKADAFVAGTDVDPSSGEFPIDLPGDTLHDHGLYSQVLYGFRYGWAAGLRGEYATGSGQSVADGMLESREDDALRDDRTRISPLLVWQPSEFSRLRLQYNYDHADHLDGNDAHTIWIGGEVLYGKHAAHKY